MAEKIILRGGRIIDPSEKIDRVGDLLIKDGKVEAIESHLDVKGREIDVRGQIISPGWIDLHTHLREPGFEYKETVATGTAAAAQGGFTTICCMPNTNPVNDNSSVTGLILEKARKGRVSVLPVGAITNGLQGEELAEIGELVEAGCVAISDDGESVMNSLIMRRALEYTKIFDIPVIDHCEEMNLTGDGVMYEGEVSTMLGLNGIPAASESIMVARDIALAELTGGHIHLAHISTEASVRLIRDAKKRGVRVTAETCPHYFILTHEALAEYNANAKMKPPLATSTDREAIRAGLADGTIDAISTDHAPHADWEKNQEIDCAPFGIIGLETALPLALSLVEDGVLTLTDMIRKLTEGPATILKKPIGRLRVGDQADITIIDPSYTWTVSKETFLSKSKNSPFIGWKMKGRATAIIVAGNLIQNK